MIDWKDRLAPGRPPLRPGEFAALTGWSDESIRKLLNSGGIPFVQLIAGGERRIPVAFARETAVRLEVLAA